MTEPAKDITPARAVSANAWDQVDAAKDRLRLDALKCPRMPWDSLHDVVGPLWPGELWVIGASTGNGKSTALMNLVGAWEAEGKKVWMVPLEQPASVMRLHWAAYALDLTSRAVLENNLSTLDRQRVADHLDWQSHGAGRDRVGFSDATTLTPNGVSHHFDDAARFGADVLILDHLNHNQPDPGGNPNGYAVLKDICHEILRCNAEIQSVRPGLMTVAAVQLHRDKLGDHLAPFKPPKPSSIEGGEVVRQTCNVALGLYRPMRAFTGTEEIDLRHGRLAIKEVLEPDRIGVAVMKHRIRGDAGTIIKLDFLRGRIRCPLTEARIGSEYRYDI